MLLHTLEGDLAAPPGVEVISLNARRTLGAVWPLADYLRRETPDVLWAHLPHNNVAASWAASLARTKTRLVCTFHNTLSRELTSSVSNRILPRLLRSGLRRADSVIAVSHGVADDLAGVIGIPRSQVAVIHNPVVFDDFERRADAPFEHPWFAPDAPPVIVGAGRLVPQKDFTTLIRAFALVRRHQDARLMILGEGPLRDDLRSLAQTLGVAEQMSLPGFIENPLPYLRRAAVFVLSSRFEGFGLALAEALACGTPVVSTDCPHGPAEILEGGRVGPLVPVADPDAMARAIRDVLASPPDRHVLRARGRDFTGSRAAEQYLEQFRRHESG
jgi:glycosyltransferase involved in cell wall biosynthesis